MSVWSVPNRSNYVAPTDAAVSDAELASALITKVDKGALTINVKDYGAVGNGTIDDTAAIQAAVAALPWPNSPASLYFPPGKYLLSSAITFSGAGKTSTPQLDIIGYGAQLYTTTAGISMFNITNTVISNVAVRVYGITFLTNAASTAVIINNSELSHFTNCRFTGSFSTGVEIKGTSTYTQFIGCIFDNMARGLLLTNDASYLRVANCMFAEQLSGSPLNWIEAPSGSGTANVSIVNNTFYGTGATVPIIRITQGRLWTISNNVFSFCPTDCVRIGFGGTSDQHIITNNSFYFAGTDVIRSEGGNRLVITGNLFSSMAAGTPADTYNNIRIRDAFGSAQGSGCVVANNVSTVSATALDQMVKFDATCTNNVVMGNIGAAGFTAAHASNQLVGNITA